MTPSKGKNGSHATLVDVTEREFQRWVEQVAEMTGWLLHHETDSRRSRRGFPDLIMVRRDRLIAAELKSAKGRVRPEQKVWLDRLEAAGVEVYLWRPSDADAIVQCLTENLAPRYPQACDEEPPVTDR
jgi:hypothetical protein